MVAPSALRGELTIRLARLALFSVVVVAFGLLRGSGESSSALAQGQLACTVTVQPEESIQKAIDQAPEGAVICLAPGRWEENLAIQKSLTLRGTGKEPKEVWIVGAKEGHPVVRIESQGEIEVVIENLTAAEAKGSYCATYEPQRICPDGLQVLGKAKVLIKDVQVSDNKEGVGLRVWGPAQVILSHSQISNNSYGWWVQDSAQVSLSYSQISNNGWGWWVQDSAQVSLTYSMVSGHERLGFFVVDSATVILSHSQVSDSGIGVVVRYSAQLSLSHSTISNNWFIGLAADIGSATVTLQNSIVSGNGRGLVVGDSTTVRIEGSEISGNEGHGIFLQDKAVAEIWGNRILNNGGYGIVLYWEGCVDADYKADFKFAGQVMGEGNTIPGKEEPDGNKQGDLCPPDYPWPPGFRK